MLTPEDKQRIEAEEKYRAEVRHKIDLDATRAVTRVRWPFKLALLAILLLILWGLIAGTGSSDPVTMAKFSVLQNGMTYSQAESAIGFAGSEVSRTNIAGITTVMYSWANPDGSNLNAMFQNGELVSKAQFGLR